VLRARIPLIRSLAKPARRVDVTLRHALSVGIQIAQVVFRASEALTRGQAIPAHRFAVVPRNSRTILVNQTQVVLRGTLALGAKCSQLLQCLRVSSNRRLI